MWGWERRNFGLTLKPKAPWPIGCFTFETNGYRWIHGESEEKAGLKRSWSENVALDSSCCFFSVHARRRLGECATTSFDIDRQEGKRTSFLLTQQIDKRMVELCRRIVYLFLFPASFSLLCCTESVVRMRKRIEEMLEIFPCPMKPTHTRIYLYIYLCICARMFVCVRAPSRERESVCIYRTNMSESMLE